jgi:pyruvate formate lyase activating enzyme
MYDDGNSIGPQRETATMSNGRPAKQSDGSFGTVFNITKYMLEDGPGIRTVIFFKSCPLRCLWCSNPLGQTAESSLVYLKHKCIACQACVAACDNAAVFLDEEGKIGRDLERCRNCGKCTLVCPVGARELRGRSMTVEEVLQRVEKDRIFYRRGSGGITLSGGEILMQPAFAANILREASRRLIHTAIETCAFGSWEDLASVLLHTDLAFIDIKHTDAATHKKLTGRSNRQILSNIQKAAQFCLEFHRKLILRLAVVPGLNDSKTNLDQMVEFLNSLTGNWELNLLPYHRYGVSKYDWLGKRYELLDVQPPSRERLEELTKYFHSRGILCSLGGGEIKSAVTQ